MALLEGRRRAIIRRGRAMTLRRALPTSPVTYAECPLLGFQAFYRPEHITGGVRQGDARVQILNDEIAALSWPGPPVSQDLIVIDGRTWAVVGALAVYEGSSCIGFDLHVRGG